jgi:hypothetical protein
MGSQNDSSLNNKIVINNNEILFNLANEINNVIEDLTNRKEIDNIIRQLKNIIIIINNAINDNKKRLEQVREEIKNYHNDVNLANNDNKIILEQVKQDIINNHNDVNNRLENVENLLLDMNNIINKNENMKISHKNNINLKNLNEIKDKIKDFPYLKKLENILMISNFEFKYRRLVLFLLEMNYIINQLNIGVGDQNRINELINKLMDGKAKIIYSIYSGKLKNDVLMDISLGTIEDIEQIILRVNNNTKKDKFKSYFESDKCAINNL